MTEQNLLEGIVIAPIDPEKVQETINKIMDLMAEDGVKFSEAKTVLNELQDHINAWEANRNSLHELANRVGLSLPQPVELPNETVVEDVA